MTGLTRKQAELLAWLRDYCAKHRHSPSFDEMARGVGLKSKSGVHRLVEGLIERGYVEAVPSLSRTIRPVDHRAITIDADHHAYILQVARATGQTPQQVVCNAVMRAHPVTPARRAA